MTQLHRSRAALRIIGDNLVPDTVTALLGCEPTLGYTKGQLRRTLSNGKEVLAKTGLWLLEAADSEPGNLDKQVSEMVGMMSHDMNVWAHLSEQFEIEIYCGFFMEDSNEWFSVSAETLLALGERGIELVVEMYGQICETKGDDPCPCGSGLTYNECCNLASNVC